MRGRRIGFAKSILLAYVTPDELACIVEKLHPTMQLRYFAIVVMDDAVQEVSSLNRVVMDDLGWAAGYKVRHGMYYELPKSSHPIQRKPSPDRRTQLCNF